MSKTWNVTGRDGDLVPLSLRSIPWKVQPFLLLRVLGSNRAILEVPEGWVLEGSGPGPATFEVTSAPSRLHSNDGSHQGTIVSVSIAP